MQLWLDIDRSKGIPSNTDLGPRLAKKSVGRRRRRVDLFYAESLFLRGQQKVARGRRKCGCETVTHR